jgi:protein-S-isoprenylcysteine O-methyltransferase Ste14
MYFGCILALAGIAGLLGSLTPWIVVVLFGIVADRVFIVAEERKLSARFGAPWREYASNTRRWI